MQYVKTIVCLANSYKPRGRCIAGREMVADGKCGEWIRPVSARPKGEVTISECSYQNKTIPEVLDIIDVPLLNAVASNPQTENHILDPEYWWAKKGAFPRDELERFRDRPSSLWINSGHTKTGVNDCISSEEASTVKNSLLLIKKKDFTVEVGSKIWDGVKSRTYRGRFTYNGTPYSLSVTDPTARDAFALKDEGEYQLADVYLCISLTERYDEDGRHHKLVAAVIRSPRS